MLFTRALAVLTLLAAPAMAQSQSPTGEGEPDAVSCRAPQPIANSRMRGPQVCRPNRVWAQYRKDGMDIAPDGIHDMPRSSQKILNCRTMGGGGGNTGMAATGMTVCD